MEKSQAGFVESAEEMYERLKEWRGKHPEASFDEIAEEVGRERRELMGQLLSELALARQLEVEALVTECPSCQEPTVGKGKKERGVSHREGETTLSRGHRYCAKCKKGFFPLDEQLKLTKKNWSPETIRNAVRLGVEIASYERAAAAFEELTGVALSKSSLHQMVVETGSAVVKEQEAEAQAVVQVPKKEEEVVWREVPDPESEVMAVSSDGVMVNIIDEGWKEVKAVSVSAVNRTLNEESGEIEVNLSHHSYRAGLWDAATFTNHHWAEACRRGLEKAKTVVCISDGALWIWAIVFLCFSTRIEVLDWWHAVQRLWAIAHGSLEPANAAPWVHQAKGWLARSQLRYLFRQVRRLYPRGTPLPEPVRQSIGYLFRNRRRMDYATFRHLGLPIGSGTIESACKTLVQARMKQAGMRWSRNGAQSMIALRSLLLSDRWHELPLPT